MQTKTTFATAERGTSTVSLIDVPTVGALLGRVPGINQDGLFSDSLGFVGQELLELEECPAIELAVEISAFPTLLDSYTFQIFKCKNGMGCLHDLLRNAVVLISHKSFFSPAELLELSSGGRSTFRLEFIAEMGILAPDIFDSIRVEKLIVGTDGNIDDAPVDAEDITMDWFGLSLFDCDVEEECSVRVGQRGRFDLPAHVLLIVRWKRKGCPYPASEGGYARFSPIEPDSYHPGIVSDSTVQSEHRELLEFDRSESLAGNVSGTGRKAGRESELFSDRIIGCIVNNTLAPGMVLISPLGTKISSEIVSFDTPNEGIFLIWPDSELEFDGSCHCHIFTYIDRMLTTERGGERAIPPPNELRGLLAQ